MTNNQLTDNQLTKIIESAEAVISALAGTNDDVHPDNSTKMCRLWDSLNDDDAPSEVVLSMARELQRRRQADKNYFMYGIAEPDGSAYLDEVCVSRDIGLLETITDELNTNEDTDGYRVVALFTALPLTDDERAELQERRKVTADPVRYLNKFSGACVTLEQQPNAAEDCAVYEPLYAAPQLATPAPEGWRMVPVVPTEDMIICGFESRPDESFSEPEVWEAYKEMSGCQQAAYRAKLCWEAMLKAAPPATIVLEVK